MPYATFELHGNRRAGRVTGDRLIPLEGIRELGRLTDIETLKTATESPAEAVSVRDVRVCPVVPEPGKIICLGLNYLTHVGETGRDLPAYPVFFTKFASSLLGPYDDIVLPAESSQVDY